MWRMEIVSDKSGKLFRWRLWVMDRCYAVAHRWWTTRHEAGRCESVGGSFHSRCGLPAGHVGSHTALIPTGAPWFPK